MSQRLTRKKTPNNSVVPMTESRGKKILDILRKDKAILSELRIPKHESTKGLQPYEVRKLLDNKQCLLNESLPKTGPLIINTQPEDLKNNLDINKEPQKSEATNIVNNVDREQSAYGDTNYDSLEKNTTIIDHECLQDKHVSSVWPLGAGEAIEANGEKGNRHYLSQELGFKAMIADVDIGSNLLLMDGGGNVEDNSSLGTTENINNVIPSFGSGFSSKGNGNGTTPYQPSNFGLVPYSCSSSSSQEDFECSDQHLSTSRSYDNPENNSGKNTQGHLSPSCSSQGHQLSTLISENGQSFDSIAVDYSSSSFSSCYDSDADPEYLPCTSTASKSSDISEETENEYIANNCDETSLKDNCKKKNRNNHMKEDVCKDQRKVLSPYNCIDYDSEDPTKYANTASYDDFLSSLSEEEQPSSTQADTIPPKRVRNKDYCFFCESWVTTFARHVVRNHSIELEVQEIMSHPIKSEQRKSLLTLLRKKGNYLASKIGIIRPVRKPATDNAASNPLPCTFCFGLYSRKQLWKHRKKCPQNPGTVHGRAQAAGQSLLSKDFINNQQLHEKVFQIMRPDEISLAAQKDTLICAFGSRYLRTHDKAHQYTICSRKMRELSRLLLRVKKLEPKIKNLIHALRPENFDLLVEAARIESGHNKQNDTFSAPTYGMNIGTSLKDCCEIAIFQALKRKFCIQGKSASELEGELRTTILLIKSNWNVEISHQASNCLNTNKMNKVTIVPLASDLKKLRNFLLDQGNVAAQCLKNNKHDSAAFKTLTDNVYCRVILLCRKRVGELQRLPLALYQSVVNKHNYEEFKDIVKPSEMILIRKFKRVVIQGKRKVTPVLFSLDVQEHIDLLISLRKNFVKDSNPYLFASTSTDNPVVGYKVLAAQAKKAGLQIPEAFKSKALRKHLAIISQLFHMSEQDIEQLSSFMGHTPGIHRSEYRLPDDLFQTSKIAKLLLAMETGQSAKYKGKSLDEIDLDENILTEGNQHSEPEDCSEEDISFTNDSPTIENVPTQTPDGLKMKPDTSRPRPKRQLVKWEEEEKAIVVEFFKEHIQNKRPPKKHECEQLLNQNKELLKNKTWLKVKVFVQNIYTNKIKCHVK